MTKPIDPKMDDFFIQLSADNLYAIVWFLEITDFKKLWLILRLSWGTAKLAQDVLKTKLYQDDFIKVEPILYKKLYAYYAAWPDPKSDVGFWIEQCERYSIGKTSEIKLYKEIIALCYAKDFKQVEFIASEVDENDFLAALLKTTDVVSLNHSQSCKPYCAMMLAHDNQPFLNFIYERYKNFQNFDFLKQKSFSPFMLAVICRQPVALLDDIALDDDPDVLLSEAALYGYTEIVSYFLEHSTRKPSDKACSEALEVACRYNNDQVISLLLTAGAEVTFYCWTNIFYYGNYNAFCALNDKSYQFDFSLSVCFENIGQYGYEDLLECALVYYNAKSDKSLEEKRKIRRLLEKAIEFKQYKIIGRVFKFIESIKADISDFLESGNNNSVALGLAFATSKAFLHYVIARSDTRMLKYMLDQPGVKKFLNSTNRDLEKPTHLASRSGNLEMVKILVEAGASIGNNNIHAKNEFDIAVDCKSTALILYYLQEHPAICGPGNTLLNRISYVFSYNGFFTTLLNYLLEKDPNLPQAKVYQHGSKFPVTPLYLATAGGALDKVKLLISKGAKQGEKLANHKDEFDAALELGDQSLVQYYLEEKHVTAYGDRFYRRISTVFECGHLEVAIYLLGKYPELANHSKFLMLACKNDDTALVKLLIERGAKFEASQLYYVCKFAKSIEILQYFINNISNVNEKDIDGNTVLHHLLFEDKKGEGLFSIEKIKLLVDAGFDINSQNNDGVTVLQLILEKYVFLPANYDDESQLKKHTDKVDQAVQFILSHKTPFELKWRSKSFEVTTTRLHLACMSHQETLVEHELQTGVSINEQDSDGNTALYTAVKAEYCKQSIVKLLLNNNINPSMHNRKGQLADDLDIEDWEIRKCLPDERRDIALLAPLFHEAYKAKPTTEMSLAVNLLIAYCEMRFHAYHNVSLAKIFLKIILTKSDNQISAAKELVEWFERVGELDERRVNPCGTFYSLMQFVKHKNLKAYLPAVPAKAKTSNKVLLEQYQQFGLFQWRHHRSEAGELIGEIAQGKDEQKAVKDLCSNKVFVKDLNPTGDFAKILYQIRY